MSESSWKVWAGPLAREAESAASHPPVGLGPHAGARYVPAPTSSAARWFMREPLWEEFPIWSEASSRVTPLQREREESEEEEEELMWVSAAAVQGRAPLLLVCIDSTSWLNQQGKCSGR